MLTKDSKVPQENSLPDLKASEDYKEELAFYSTFSLNLYCLVET
jgi:hypothetical protein